MPDTRHQQITLNVQPHRRAGEGAFMFATLKIKGDFRLDHDLHGGDELTVTVADADGNVITNGKLVCATPTFKDVTEKGIYIGIDRIHVAELTAE